MNIVCHYRYCFPFCPQRSNSKFMPRQFAAALTLCIIALQAGCDGDRREQIPEPKAAPGAEILSAEDRALLEQVKAREKAKAELQASPWRFIEANRWEFFDKGIINSYTRLTAVEFTNRSSFDISDLQGKVTYFNAQDVEMATLPFTAKGELRAGQTAKLKVTAGEITGKASKARITVERLRVIGAL